MAAAARVLVVDDHPRNVKLARVLLTTAGDPVRTAGRAEDRAGGARGRAPRTVPVTAHAS